MFALDQSTITEWTNINGFWFPMTIGQICPHCARAATFNPTLPIYDPHRKTIAASAKCPSCSETINFWAIEPWPAVNSNKKGCDYLAMYPRPGDIRAQVQGAELLPEPVRRAYQDALSVFNSGAWGATATCCRRTLESIIYYALSPSQIKGTLSEQLKKVGKATDLSKPFVTASEALTDGGSIAGYFNLDTPPSRSSAERTLDLIECLLCYLYTLPAEVERLSTATEPEGNAANKNKDATIGKAA